MKTFYLAGAIALMFASCTKQSISESSDQPQSAVKSIIKTTETQREADTTACTPSTVTVNLLAGQTANAGTVTATNDGTNLYVTYTCANGWQMSTMHLYAGPYADAPQNNGGNPVPGRFPYKQVFTTPVNSYTQTIPLSTLPACYIIAAHAVLKKNGSSETGWCQGLDFPGNNWGMYFDYCNCQ